MPSVSAWADSVPPGHIGAELDPPSFLFMGADPSWTPARERYVDRPVPGSPRGHTNIPARCPLCGGSDAAEAGDDPLGDSELVVVACGRCMRAAGKHAGRLTGEIGDGDLKRPGRMAARISGKGDPVLNAYLSPVLSAKDAAALSQPNGPARKRPAGKPSKSDKPTATGKPGGSGKLATGRGSHRTIGEYL